MHISHAGSSSITTHLEYRGAVGALQYLTWIRPDIPYDVNQVCQFMHKPTTSHWTIVKWILRYIKGTVSHGLIFRRSSSLALTCFSDADWVGHLEDCSSTSSQCVFLGNNIISWSAKKQPTVAKSSMESEYRSLAHLRLNYLGSYISSRIFTFPWFIPQSYGVTM